MRRILLPSRRLTRLRESIRRPRQAALMTRLPFIGRRAPRTIWRRRQPRLRSLLPWRQPERQTKFAAVRSRVRGIASRFSALDRRSTVSRIAGRVSALNRRSTVGASPTAVEAQGRRRASLVRGSRAPIAVVAVAAVAGAAAMYYADPQQGRRRRALVRDRLAHLRRVVMRDVPRTAERRGRFLKGVAKGIGHEAASLAHLEHHAPVDDDTLVARVRSEVLRDNGIKAGEIHVDAYEGCVTLRGQLDHAEEIRRIVRETGRVAGVREVRSYLHLPGTPPPNKREAYEHLPEHLSIAHSS